MEREAGQMNKGDRSGFGIVSSPGWEGVVERQQEQDHQREILGLPESGNTVK